MNILLDTHVLIWWMQGSGRLGSRAKAEMFEPGTRLWLSAASVWEMAIKSVAGRLTLHAPLDASISALVKHGFRSLPISTRHALAAGALPPHHSDPFDRMLIAQAQCEDLVLATVDSAISRYDVRTLDASR
jgi:PIN domain nuclease of toxin-antitoxin system